MKRRIVQDDNSTTEAEETKEGMDYGVRRERRVTRGKEQTVYLSVCMSTREFGYGLVILYSQREFVK